MAIAEVPITGNTPTEGDFAYVMVPVTGRPGAFVALFEDGSYAEWTPMGAFTNGGS